jgi:hypothetical protein
MKVKTNKIAAKEVKKRILNIQIARYWIICKSKPIFMLY